MKKKLNKIQKADLKRGAENEEKVYNWLRDHNIPAIQKMDDKYHVFDFKSDDYLFELKSRNYNHNRFNDWIFGINKIKHLVKNNIDKAYFYFLFEDGLYRWRYKKNGFTVRRMGRKDRGKVEMAKCVCVKTVDLEFVTNDIINEEVCMIK